MKNNKKILIIAIIILLIIVITLGIFIFIKNNKDITLDNTQNNKNNQTNKTTEKFVIEYENGTKVNSSNKFNENKTIEGLDIKNIQFTYNSSSKMSVLIADVENNTSSNSPKFNVRVTLLDKEGNQIDYMDGIINELKPGERTMLNIGIMADFSNAYDFTIEKK